MRVGERVELINMEDRSIWQDRCLEKGLHTGVVRFVGALYVGVDLDQRITNVKAWRRFGQSTDGTLYGKRYFRTHVGCGIFIPSQNVRQIVEKSRHTRSGRVFARRERVVDINSCTLNDLIALRGIGQVLARRILRNRPFRSLDDLSRVERLNHAVIESLRPYVRFGNVATKNVQRCREERRDSISRYENKLKELQVRIAREKIARDMEIEKKKAERERAATLRRLEEERRKSEERTLRRLREERKREAEKKEREAEKKEREAVARRLEEERIRKANEERRRVDIERSKAREEAKRRMIEEQRRRVEKKKNGRKNETKYVKRAERDDPEPPPPAPPLEDKLKTMLRISKPYNVRHVATGASGRFKLSSVKSTSQQQENSYISFAIVLALKAELVQEPRPLVLPKSQTDTPSSDNAFAEIVKHTPHFRGHLSFQEFRFLDYAPSVFRSLRELFGVRHESYLKSMSEPLKGGAQGDGKSGMCFFFTQDRKYILKTVKVAEIPILLGFLPDYHQYFALQRTSRGERPVRQQQCSLLPRFFGLHKVCFPDRGAFYLIVMRNILFTESSGVPIHRVFDLKGSMAGRFVDTKNEKPEPQKLRNGLNVDKRTLKDLNFTAEIMLSSSEERELLIQQLRSDVHFLTRHNIMDYSLLLGIMFLQSDLPWRTSEDSMDLMPHKSVSSRARYDTADKAYLHASVLRAYTSRKVMATLLPEGENLVIRATIKSYAQVPEKNYIVYAVQLMAYKGDHLRDSWTVFRRYSDFDRLAHSLNQELRKTGAQTPVLPPKRIFGSMNDTFLKQRMKGLENWIRQILSMFGDKTSFFENLRSFLTKGANCSPCGAVIEHRNRKISDHVVNRLSGAGRGHGLKASLAPAGVRGRSKKTARVCIFFGIIDILQSFDAKKQIESMYKSVRHNGTAISAVETAAYGKRFMDYMMEIFPNVRDFELAI